MEKWEAISGKSGYMVSSEGRVASPRGVLTQERCKDRHNYRSHYIRIKEDT